MPVQLVLALRKRFSELTAFLFARTCQMLCTDSSPEFSPK